MGAIIPRLSLFCSSLKCCALVDTSESQSSALYLPQFESTFYLAVLFQICFLNYKQLIKSLIRDSHRPEMEYENLCIPRRKKPLHLSKQKPKCRSTRVSVWVYCAQRVEWKREVEKANLPGRKSSTIKLSRVFAVSWLSGWTEASNQIRDSDKEVGNGKSVRIKVAFRRELVAYNLCTGATGSVLIRECWCNFLPKPPTAKQSLANVKPKVCRFVCACK